MADLKISALTSATTPLAGTEVLPIVQSSTTKKVSIENVTAGRTVNVKYLAVNTSLKTWYANSVPIQFGIGGVLEARDNYAPLSAWAANAYLDASGNDTYIADGEATRLEQAGGLFRWKTAPSGAAGAACTFTNRMELANATGNLDLKTGNLIIGTSGKGIDFSATSGSGTSELLSDYEEGTWTPTILGGTTAGTPTYTSQVGSYTKIGRQVTLRINLAWSAISGSPTGLMLIGGLPFAYDAVFATFPISEQNLSHTAGTSLVVAMAGGGYSSTQFNLAQIAPATAFTALNIVTSGQVFGTVTYFV